MCMTRRFLLLLSLLLVPAHAHAQTTIRLYSDLGAGSIAADATTGATLNTGGLGTVGFQVSGTFIGTIELQCSVDGTNWSAMTLTPTSSSTTVTSITATGIWTATSAGCFQVRTRATLWTSGTATTTILAVTAGGGGTSGGGVAANITQWGGTAIATNSGNASAGTLRSVEATDSQLSAGVGATGDAAVAVGATGSLSAKLRQMSSSLDAVETAVELIDNSVSGSGLNISQIGGASPVTARCDDTAKVTSANINLTAGTGNTEIVALSGSTVIYVCGYVLMVGGADATQWITGTGTACATDETDKVSFNFAANGDGISVASGGHVQFKTAAGGALCVERTSSVALTGSVTYVQE